MKIYDSNLIGSSPTETGRAQESQNVSRAGTAKTPASRTIDGASDRVEFSGTMSRLSRTLATFESARATHVQALAGQYQSGTYQPDSAATSRGMITEAVSPGLQ